MNFKEWFVGFTDGNGYFTFSQTEKGGWAFRFKIVQSKFNARALYYIKSALGMGRVLYEEGSNMVVYSIERRELLLKLLLVFEEYHLFTSKKKQFEKFKRALLIATDEKLSKEERDLKILQLDDENIPEVCGGVMTKSWVVGFIEAEGSFYLIRKGEKRIVHGFEVVQAKGEERMLKQLAEILGGKVEFKKTYNIVKFTDNVNVQRMIEYFEGTMKGVKSLEFKIWSRSFRKKQSYEELVKIRGFLCNLQNKYKIS